MRMLAVLKDKKIGDKVLVAEFVVLNEFVFLPGEYVQIVLQNGEKRYFSITNSPSEPRIVRIATRPSASLFKTTLQQMPLGTEIEVNGPWGDVLLPASPAGGSKDSSKSLVFLAGGIGITPFLSMIPYATEESKPYRMQLLHFGDLEEFNHDLERFARENPKFAFRHLDERVSPEIIKSNVDDPESIYYVAGPPEFVNQASNALADLKITQRDIILESYTGY